MQFDATTPIGDEWMTPSDIVERARKVLGVIDLDPMSSAKANETVKADRFYTQEDEATDIDRTWAGNVFLNPPFSKGKCARAIKKLIGSYILEYINSAVVVVNNATDTAWFRTLVSEAAAVCFPKRIAFISPVTGLPVKGNRHAQAIVYLGENVDGFFDAFSGLGPVVIPYVDHRTRLIKCLGVGACAGMCPQHLLQEAA